MALDPQRSSDAPDPNDAWQPAAARPNASRDRAARFTWISAAAVLALFGGCAGLLGLVGAMPRDQMVAQMTEQNPDMAADQVAFIEWFHATAPTAAVVVLLLFVLPAVVLVFAGFGVRRGRPWGRWTALGILSLHAALMGLWLLGALIEGIATGSVVELVLVVVLIGSLLALLLYTLRLVWRARGQPPGDDEIEPWNRHLVGR